MGLFYSQSILFLSLIFLTSGVKYQNGRFKILVRMDKSISSDEQHLTILKAKNLFIKASKFLHQFTSALTSFDEITFIYPSDDLKNDLPLWSGIDKADVLIKNSDQPQPLAVQSEECGKQGDIITVPSQFLNLPNVAPSPEQLLIEEWLKFRYGVFEDTGWLNVKPIEYQYKGNSTLSSCLRRRLFNDSVLEYDVSQTQLCQSKKDDFKIPSRQNILCKYRNVWDVISHHTDFENVKPYSFHSPQINLFRQSSMHIAFIIEASEHLEEHLIPFHQAMFTFIRNELPKESSITLIEHKDGAAKLILKQKSLTDIKTREEIAEDVSQEGSGASNLLSALDIAKEIIAENPDYQTSLFIPIFNSSDLPLEKLQQFQNLDIFLFFVEPTQLSFHPLFAYENIHLNLLRTPFYLCSAMREAFLGLTHSFYPGNQFVSTIKYERLSEIRNSKFVIDENLDELAINVFTSVTDSINELVIIPPTFALILLSSSIFCKQNLQRGIVTCRIPQPTKGLWLILVEHKSSQHIYLDISIYCGNCSYVTTKLSTRYVTLDSLQLPLIFSQVHHGRNPKINVSLHAQVRQIPTDLITEKVLRDNGRDPDIKALDDIHTGQLENLKENGWYEIKVAMSNEHESFQKEMFAGFIYVRDEIFVNSTIRKPPRIVDLEVTFTSDQNKTVLLMWSLQTSVSFFDVFWSSNYTSLLRNLSSVSNNFKMKNANFATSFQQVLFLSKFDPNFCFVVRAKNSYGITGETSNVACIKENSDNFITSTTDQTFFLEQSTHEQDMTITIALSTALGITLFILLITILFCLAILNRYKLVKKKGEISVEEIQALNRFR